MKPIAKNKKTKDGKYMLVKDEDGNTEKKYIYHCYICGKEIIDYRPVRLVKQLYGYGQYKQYYTIRNYDFCKECWWALDDLLFKWQRFRKNKKGI